MQPIMSYKGRVKDGVIVLESGVKLADGTTVRVEPDQKSSAVEQVPPISRDELDPVWRMAELAVPTGIPDLATNADHYLYGHPKLKDARQ